MTAQKPSYTYAAVPLRVIDGDTIEVQVDLGFRTFVVTPLRLLGVNAPEKNTPEGMTAMLWTKGWLDKAGAWKTGLLVVSAHPGDYGDKYGRWLATVRDSTGHCLNEDLLGAGHAVPMP